MANRKSFGFLKSDLTVDIDDFIQRKEMEGLKFVGVSEDFPPNYLWLIFEEDNPQSPTQN